VHATCAATAHARTPPGTHLAPYYTPPLSTPAENKLLVPIQQAAHPLRVGGHRGLRLRWLWLEMGSGKLHQWLKWPRALKIGGCVCAAGHGHAS